jgi:chitin disaccharide deacetylase
MSELKLRRIWLCADDYGMSPGVDDAIRDLIERGRINATSVMVASSNFSRDQAVALIVAAPARATIGLHLTLTAPFRPLTQNFAPLHAGAFLPLSAMAGRALARRQTPALLDAEIAAQFAAFRAVFGRAPDFVDGHQHIHVFPQIREAVLRAVKQNAPAAWLRQCGRPAAARKSFADPKGFVLDALSARLRRLAAANGVRTNPAFAGTYSFAPRADYTKLFPHFLDGLPDGGLVMCHPGKVDAELRRLDPVTDLREREYAYFLGEDFPRLFSARGLTLA